MYKTLNYFLLAFFLLPFFVVAQNVDSLKLELKNAKHDTTKCNILNVLIEAENDEAIWSKYNDELLSIAEKQIKLTKKNSPEFLIYQKHFAGALNNNGVLSSSRYDFKNAILYYEKSLKIQETINDKKGIATTQSNIGFIYRNIGNLQKALEYYTKSIKTQEEIADEKGVALSYNNISSVYRDSGNNAKALFYLEKSLKIREKINDKVGLASTLNNIGALYNFQGDIKKAIAYYMRSIKILESLNDFSSLPTLLTNLGIIYNDLNDLSSALKYFNKSLEIQKKINDQKGISYSLNFIGMVYLNQNKLEEAYDLFNKGLKIQEENDFKQGMASSLNNIGGVFNRKKDEQTALIYYEKSLKILYEINDLHSISKTLNNIGIAYFKLKQYNVSIKKSTESFKIAKEIGAPDLMRNAAKQLYLTYNEVGKFKESLENYELYIQMRDSINNLETQKATIKQQTQYEFDKQQALEKEKHDAELLIQKEKATTDKKKQQVIIFSVSLVLLLVGIFSFLLYKRFKTTQQQKQIIELKEKETQEQKHLIEEKHKEITDSINYAERIQRSFLATKNHLDEYLNKIQNPYTEALEVSGSTVTSSTNNPVTSSTNNPVTSSTNNPVTSSEVEKSTGSGLDSARPDNYNYFIFFQPKDVVSGDFYWSATLNNGNFILATADSTGHGVPGAIMSLLNITSLEKAIETYTTPSEILNATRKIIIGRLKRDGSPEGGKDGMDCSLCVYDFNNMQLHMALANNPVWIVRRNQSPFSFGEGQGVEASSTNHLEIIEIKPDKMPVGKHDKQDIPFTAQSIQLQKGDVVYTLTDGFPDQFGGEKGKKFMSKNLRELLAQNAHLPMHEQKQLLASTFQNWIGNLEQVDDVTVIGVKI